MRVKMRPSLVVATLTLALITTVASADPADDVIRAEMKSQNIPGLALAVVKDGKVVKAQGYGVANLKTKEPVSAETVFKIASVSKQFVATGIMVLVQDGRLTLADPVARFLPDAPAAWKGITVRHLLNHTAGLVREPPAFDPNVVQTDIELIRSAYPLPLRFTPGEKWEYSNVGYTILVEIITRVSGQPWSQFMTDRVFKPAGLTATRTTTADRVANRALGYTDNDSPKDAADWVAVRAGGAFLSNVLDLARWDAVLSTDSLLTEASRREMWTATILNSGVAHPYGLGWHVNRPGQRRGVWHSGGLPGFTAQFRRYLDDRTTVIVLLNSDDVDDESIAFRIAELYLPGR